MDDARQVTYPFPPDLLCACGCPGAEHWLDPGTHRTTCDAHGGHEFAPTGMTVELRERNPHE